MMGVYQIRLSRRQFYGTPEQILDRAGISPGM